MQIKDGSRYAFGFCAEEVRAVLRKFKPIAAKVMDDYCLATGADPQEFTPLFSLDNASWHVGADDELCPTERVTLPPYSPDIHRVIEHCFNNLTRRMKRGLLPALAEENAKCKFSLQFWREFVGLQLKEANPLKGVQKDIEHLPLTYQNIIDRGGEWADSKHN